MKELSDLLEEVSESKRILKDYFYDIKDHVTFKSVRKRDFQFIEIFWRDLHHDFKWIDIDETGNIVAELSFKQAIKLVKVDEIILNRFVAQQKALLNGLYQLPVNFVVDYNMDESRAIISENKTILEFAAAALLLVECIADDVKASSSSGYISRNKLLDHICHHYLEPKEIFEYIFIPENVYACIRYYRSDISETDKFGVSKLDKLNELSDIVIKLQRGMI